MSNALKAEIERLREENKCFEAMQEGVFIRIADLDAEIKRLSELVDAGKEDRKAIDELVDENLRLRELLRECQPYVEAGLSMCDTRLCDAVEKEVGDE